MFWKARGRGHELTEARIFEFDAGTTFRRAHVVCAADKGQWMEVQAMHRLTGHDVHPAVAHREPLLSEVHFEMRYEGLYMFVEATLQLSEG